MDSLQVTNNIRQLVKIKDIHLTRKQIDFMQRIILLIHSKKDKATIEDLDKVLLENQKAFPNDNE